MSRLFPSISQLFQGALRSLVVSGFAFGIISAAHAAESVKIDGSSTVYPVTEGVAEEFQQVEGNVQVTVGVSGTGGGMKKLCAGETDIANASRPVKPTEAELCAKNGIEFIELPIAHDAIAIVVHPKNTWMKSITVAELKKLWEPAAQGKITRWNQVRSEWPDKPIALFGPGTDSGTFDYFTEAIVGKEDMSRGDYTSSEDDNLLVRGVSSNEGALGYFGLAYFNENKDRVRLVPVDAETGSGPQLATKENVLSGSYKPLSRPLFVYVNKTSVRRPEVDRFVKFYLGNVNRVADEVGYVPLSREVEALANERYAAQIGGSMFSDDQGRAHPNLEALMRSARQSRTSTSAR